MATILVAIALGYWLGHAPTAPPPAPRNLHERWRRLKSAMAELTGAILDFRRETIVETTVLHWNLICTIVAIGLAISEFVWAPAVIGGHDVLKIVALAVLDLILMQLIIDLVRSLFTHRQTWLARTLCDLVCWVLSPRMLKAAFIAATAVLVLSGPCR